MKLFKCITDNEIFLVVAKDKYDAETFVIEEHFPELLDDELSDLMDVYFLANIPNETKTRIFSQFETEDAFEEHWEDIESKIDDAIERQGHDHMRSVYK